MNLHKLIARTNYNASNWIHILQMNSYSLSVIQGLFWSFIIYLLNIWL